MRKVLSANGPIMQYVNLKEKKAEAEQRLGQFLAEDIHAMTGVHKQYTVSFGELYSVITVSHREKLEEVTEIEYSRELYDDERYLLEYFGAMHGLDYVKTLSADDEKFLSLRKSFKKLPLPRWIPHADYAYYAWTVGGFYINQSIILPGETCSLDCLVTTIGHEAAHAFGEDIKNDPLNDPLEETICDFFSKEYKEYFKKHHAGKYARELFPAVEDEELSDFIGEIEAILPDVPAAEYKMRSFRDGSYNQARLLNSKVYSGDKEINVLVEQLYSLYGPRCVRLIPKLRTKEQLVDICAQSLPFEKV